MTAGVGRGADKEPSLTTREATAADLAMVTKLATRFYLEEGFAASRHGLSEKLQVLIEAANAHVCVAELDGVAVGFAVTTTVVGLEAAMVAELQDLYVAPTARHGGVAGLLVEAARDWATQAGCTVLDVVVEAGGDARHGLTRFYGRRGFQDTGRRLLSQSLTESPG